MKIIRTILSLILGIVVGSVVNMGLVTLGSIIIPAPEGVDVNVAESIAASIHLFKPVNFLFPFLAHALGTLTGALTAYLIARDYRSQLAYTIGALNFIGGIAVSMMIPAPAWYLATDLLLAYFPFAYAAIHIGGSIEKN